jgi:FG-GAP-like repeat/ASPIC and UnbV
MTSKQKNRTFRFAGFLAGLLFAVAAIGGGFVANSRGRRERRHPNGSLAFQARKPVDTGGFLTVLPMLEPWPSPGTLEQVRDSFRRVGYRNAKRLDESLAHSDLDKRQKIGLALMKSSLVNYEGDPGQAYKDLEKVRHQLDDNDDLAREWLYLAIFFQGVTALRLGENENCVMCRGESSCIIPISASAVHTKPEGSRLAIKHFTEYLQQFPDDLGIRWLLNVAHMTLGEYPEKVDPRFLVSLDRFLHSEFDIGKFRDVGHLVGVNRFNQAGGAIMDDFDGDGLLDIVVTSMDPEMAMAYYRNRGDGAFEDRSEAAGVSGQLGGLVCYQTDYNNDGRLDIFIPRGAWLPYPVRPSLLRNDGDGRFSDVTAEAGLSEPLNSISAAWSDYDNDGWLDLFVACERQPNHLYHNRGNGTFEEIAAKVGVISPDQQNYKGAAWVDVDNDRYPDLFLNCLSGYGRLFRNNRDGTFSDVTSSAGIDGPRMGFPCWAWDYDNDGWLDIFATSSDHSLTDIVRGLLGQAHARSSSRLFRNLKGTGFENKIQEAGLDMSFAAMGCNFGDFDNDGWLDFYLGTGDPDLSTLVPNRMFKNVAGQRFAEITGSSGTGHLQKGHAVACGDWDCDGDVDIFIQMGGPTQGDKYHNILFQNPGQGNNSLTVKLVGVKTNRAAIGARIKAVTAGDRPLNVYRHVSSGSSFGANPLRQTIGLAKAGQIASLQVDWPTSGTTQVFRDIPANQAIEVTEFANDYKALKNKPIPLPE